MAPDHAQLRVVTLFFFLSLLDEPLALASSKRVFRRLRQSFRDRHGADISGDIDLIRCCQKEWEIVRGSPPKKLQAAISHNAGWVLPQDFDLGPWKSFVRASEPTEHLAIIWSKLLGFPDTTIAEALGISQGTIRHRLTRGLRGLASFGLSGRSGHG
jgi:hypothetical protein